MANITVADLARELGLSKSSVSCALNGKPGVSEQTRERVLAYAESLGWFPSWSARSLSRAKADAVGVVLRREPGLIGTEPYYMRVIAGIESVLEEAEVSLVLRLIGAGPSGDLELYRRWAGERRVDGVILFDQLGDDPRFELLNELSLPAIVHGVPPGEGAKCLRMDYVQEAASIADHLAENGLRTVVHLTGPCNLLHEQIRRASLARLCAERGIEVTSVESDYTIGGGDEFLRSTPLLPDAVVCANDLLALGVQRSAEAQGVTVPGRLAIVSWDDSILCQLSRPALTALERFPEDSGAASARMLLRLINGEPVEEEHAPTPILRPRTSSVRVDGLGRAEPPG